MTPCFAWGMDASIYKMDREREYCNFRRTDQDGSLNPV